VLKGWALFEEGQMAEGLTIMEEGIEAWQTIGFAHFTPFLLALKAGACLKANLLKEGVSSVDSAFVIGRRGGDRYWSAELHRLRGELLRAAGADSWSVAAQYQQALEITRQQGARMLELRAAVSLARLQQENSQSTAVQQALVEVYDWFSEGFDSCDLQEARELLRTMA